MKRLLILTAFILLGAFATFAQSKDEQAITAAVEKLRIAMLDAKEADLAKLTSPLLNYGHSNGLLEDKKEFIRALVSGESNFTRIELSEQSIVISGDVATVRHKLIGDTENKGKEPAAVKLGVFLVWQKVKGEWLLLGRQAFKLP